MSQSVHLISKNIPPGYGSSESRCLPCSGISGKAVAVSFCPYSNHRTYSKIKFGSIKCNSGAASFVCRASSGSPRRNSDFSKQNRHSFSRNRNRHNEDRDSFENLEESDLLTSRNGPLLSFPNTSKFQATAAPGPREKEIVELFRKVQAQLRERATVKEDKKVESSKGKVKESETVDSLLKLLRKHSIEQGKKKVSSVSSGDIAVDQPEQNGLLSEDRSTGFLNPNNKERSEVPKHDSTSFRRPPSSFRRRSPVPQVKFQPIYPNEDPINSTSYLDLTGDKKKLFEAHPDTAQQPELDTQEPELEMEQEPEPSFPDVNVLDELSEEESSDIDDIDEDSDQQKENAHEDLSSMKLPELRALAKSRGLKGFSKLKKGELVELLTGGSV